MNYIYKIFTFVFLSFAYIGYIEAPVMPTPRMSLKEKAALEAQEKLLVLVRQARSVMQGPLLSSSLPRALFLHEELQRLYKSYLAQFALQASVSVVREIQLVLKQLDSFIALRKSQGGLFSERDVEKLAHALKNLIHKSKHFIDLYPQKPPALAWHEQEVKGLLHSLNRAIALYEKTGISADPSLLTQAKQSKTDLTAKLAWLDHRFREVVHSTR